MGNCWYILDISKEDIIIKSIFMIMNLNNIPTHIEKVTPRQQNVSIKFRPQIPNGGCQLNDKRKFFKMQLLKKVYLQLRAQIY